jgi:hypothetical protein
MDMQPKRIVKHLNKVYEDWVSSIKDYHTQQMVEQDNVIITGGAVANLLAGEEPKDYDIYFGNMDTVKAVAEYYVKQWQELHDNDSFLDHIHVVDGRILQQWKEHEEGVTLKTVCPSFKAGVKYSGDVEGDNTPFPLFNIGEDRIKIIFPGDGLMGEDALMEGFDGDEEPEDIYALVDDAEKPPYRPVFLSANAVTLANRIQLILRFHGEPEKIHSNFDFEHCCAYWESNECDTLVTPEKVLLSIMNKVLHYRGSKYPLCSVIRTRKFIRRGWKINAAQYVKMAYQISKLDLDDIHVLEDQLIGVDTTYFTQVVKALRNMESGSFDEQYLTSLLDTVFGI